ncbi:MAG: prolyl hydroxylase family protein [Parvularculaceae bacterium]
MSATSAAQSPNVDYAALAAAPIVRASAPGLKRLPTSKAQLFIWTGFMAAETCRRVIDLATPHLRPSTITTDDPDPFFRTSSTCDLAQIDDPFVGELDETIANALGLPVAYGEQIQAQSYEVGQEFKAHTDYFEPDQPEYAVHAAARGQRTWTFMVYLNDVEGGGQTDFVRLDRRVKPRTGRAVVWNNLGPDGRPNPMTMHHGAPVTAGRKIIITKWFRDRPQ